MSKKHLEELEIKFKHKYGLDLDFNSLYSENKTEIEIYNSIESIIKNLSGDDKFKDRLEKERVESLSKSLKTWLENEDVNEVMEIEDLSKYIDTTYNDTYDLEDEEGETYRILMEKVCDRNVWRAEDMVIDYMTKYNHKDLSEFSSNFEIKEDVTPDIDSTLKDLIEEVEKGETSENIFKYEIEKIRQEEPEIIEQIEMLSKVDEDNSEYLERLMLNTDSKYNEWISYHKIDSGETIAVYMSQVEGVVPYRFDPKDTIQFLKSYEDYKDFGNLGVVEGWKEEEYENITNEQVIQKHGVNNLENIHFISKEEFNNVTGKEYDLNEDRLETETKVIDMNRFNHGSKNKLSSDKKYKKSILSKIQSKLSERGIKSNEPQQEEYDYTQDNGLSR